MSKLLKGNYKMRPAGRKKSRRGKRANITKLFEEKAVERLGGSIAFVMKKDKFVWGAEDEKT